ncbi:MAG: hypothetical protein Ta2B_14010 [Termitinemataceae bacterium]|nr:MAG: hypothetical protein Ta2B_14010 [Termitinemataceae bacterium]
MDYENASLEAMSHEQLLDAAKDLRDRIRNDYTYLITESGDRIKSTKTGEFVSFDEFIEHGIFKERMAAYVNRIGKPKEERIVNQIYVYKITYPNGKIYVGRDVTGRFLTYFGSGNKDYIQNDFTPDEMQSFCIKKEILWSTNEASPQEVTAKETEFIEKLGANNPAKGYNLRPKYTQG